VRKGELSTLLGDGQETRQNVRDTAAAIVQAVAAAADDVRESVDRAREETLRVVSGEIGGLRSDVRAVRNAAATGQAVQELRQDLRELRAFLQQAESAGRLAPEPTTRPSADDSGSTVPEPLVVPVPGTSAGAADGAPDFEKETGSVDEHPANPDPAVPAPPDAADAPTRVGEVLAQLAEVLAGGALEDLRRDVTRLGDEVAALREAVARTPEDSEDEMPAEPEPTAAEEAHDELLLCAARLSSAEVLCHRDTWEFVTGKAGAHPHFRHPQHVAGQDHGRVEADLSGRSLIAVLISLDAVPKNRKDPADWAMARTTYQRIAERLADLGPDGSRVRIVLDDRAAETEGGGAAS
jgi:hypothetical protein